MIKILKIALCKMASDVHYTKLIVILNVYSTVHVSAEFENAISIVEEMLKNFDEVSSVLFYFYKKQNGIACCTAT